MSIKYRLKEVAADFGMTTKDISAVMEKFFENEVKDTVQKLNQLKEEGCFCFNVVTDSHVSPTNPQWVARQWHTFQNIKAVNQGAEVDAIFHLGDIFGCVDCITDGFALKFWNERLFPAVNGVVAPRVGFVCVPMSSWKKLR